MILEHDSPKFAPGTVWIRTDGSKQETIIRRLEKFGDGKYDYDVFHGGHASDREYCKDLFHFQVRYEPKKS